jgi:ATP synthase protein I
VVFRFGETTGRAIRNTGAMLAVGLMFVSAVVIGAGTGYVLDGWFGTSPWLFLLFFFFGLAAGILNVYRMSAKFLK